MDSTFYEDARLDQTLALKKKSSFFDVDVGEEGGHAQKSRREDRSSLSADSVEDSGDRHQISRQRGFLSLNIELRKVLRIMTQEEREKNLESREATVKSEKVEIQFEKCD